MKHLLLTCAALLAILHSSCNNEDQEPTPQLKPIQAVSVQFKLDLDREVLPYPNTKSMPPLNIADPTPKSKGDDSETTTPSVKYFDYLEYIVYQEGKNEPYKKKQYTKQQEETDGIDANIHDELLPGKYNICFLAHSDQNVDIEQETATFQKVGDTFHHYVSLDIKEDSEVKKTFSLQRIVSHIEFVSTDVVVDSLSHFQIKAENYRKAIDLKTGQATATASTYEQNDHFKPENIGKKLTHSFYTFIYPTEDQQLHMDLATWSKRNYKSRIRKGITAKPERNKIIRFTGVLYTPKVSDDDFSIEIEKDWNTEIGEEDLGK